MAFEVNRPARGVETWTNAYEMDIFRLHYSADDEKDEDWAKRAHTRCTSEEMWRQEYEIDFYALEGSRLYSLHEAATLYDPFPIPHEWTRYFILDPHPVKPHACLYGAMNSYGELYIYREFWPSKIYNKPGRVPEDDNKVTIRQFLECVKFLESKENPFNEQQDEHIYDRIIDYAARGQGQGTSDDPHRQPNFQVRFEETMRDLGIRNWKFRDAYKDKEVGEENVNQWLMPRDVLDPGTDTFVQKSKMRISRACPELIWQLNNNRRKAQTPIEAESRDPELKRIDKRNDLTDCLKYLCNSQPQYVARTGRQNQTTYKPQYSGVNY